MSPPAKRRPAARSLSCRASGRLSALAGLLAASPAAAGEAASETEDGFYLHIGPGALLFDADARVASGGVAISGATVTIDPNLTAVTEIGYRRGTIGVSLTGGIPPLASVKGAGTLASYGTLGKIRYGPTVLTVHYHFPVSGRLRPYVGGGGVFLLIFDNQDAAVRKLRTDNHWGAAVQAGAEYRVSRRLSLYVDAKKALLRTHATGVLGGAPIEARIKLDPVVVTGGLSIRF